MAPRPEEDDPVMIKKTGWPFRENGSRVNLAWFLKQKDKVTKELACIT